MPHVVLPLSQMSFYKASIVPECVESTAFLFITATVKFKHIQSDTVACLCTVKPIPSTQEAFAEGICLWERTNQMGVRETVEEILAAY